MDCMYISALIFHEIAGGKGEKVPRWGEAVARDKVAPHRDIAPGAWAGILFLAENARNPRSNLVDCDELSESMLGTRGSYCLAGKVA